MKKETDRKLVAAALKVFSRDGLAATTKEIARVAKVNEVTLFRHFATKGHLLAAVVAEVVREEAAALESLDVNDFNLERDLIYLAGVFQAKMQRRQAFSRAILSGPVDKRLAKKIFREVTGPIRLKFIEYLQEGQRRGLVRSMDLAPAVDAFTGMIFAGVLRHRIITPVYTSDDYLQTCVQLFLRGTM